MDARTFIQKKNSDAVDELKAIDAAYMPKRSAALAAIAMTEKWLAEISDEMEKEVEPAKDEPGAQGVQPVFEHALPEPKSFRSDVPEIVMGRNPSEPTLIMSEQAKPAAENWRSARDLLPKARAS